MKKPSPPSRVSGSASRRPNEGASPPPSSSSLERENEELRTRLAEATARLAEAEETLEAIRSGAVDALVVSGTDGDQVFALKSAETPYRLLVEAMHEGALMLDPHGTILYSNSRLSALARCAPEYPVGKPLADFLLPDQAEALHTFLAKVPAEGRTAEFSLQPHEPLAKPLPVQLAVTSLRLENLSGVVVVITDLTTQKAYEAILQQTNRDLEARVQKRTRQLSQANKRLQARSEELAGVNQALQRQAQELQAQSEELQAQSEELRAQSEELQVQSGQVSDANQKLKLLNEQLLQLNRTLEAHNDCSHALLSTRDETSYLQQVCRIVAESCGRALVWVGYAEPDAEQSIRPMACAGFEQGYLEALRLTWADTERGRGPTGTAIRTGQPNMCRDMKTDPRMTPWRTEALKRGLASSLVLPLLAEGKAFGAITIYAHEPDAFSQDEVSLLNRLAGDVALGILTLRLRQARAAAEDALRQSELRERRQREFLECVVTNAGSCIAVVKGRELRYTLANPAFQAYAGSVPMVGRTYREVFPEAAAAGAESLLQRVLETGKPWKLEAYPAPVPGKADATWQGLVVRLPGDADGEPSALVVVWDITERKRAEEALQRSERGLAEAQRVAHVGSWEWDLQSGEVRWSAELYSIYGLDPRTFVPDIRSFTEFVHPDDRQTINNVVQQAVVSGLPVNIEFRIVRPDGSARVLNARGEVTDYDRQGKPRLMVGINQDITERKQAEETVRESERRLALALEGGQMGFWEWDLRTKQSVWNAKEYELLGLPPGDSPLATDLFFRHVHPEDTGELERTLQEAFAGREDWRHEFRIIRADGQVRWLAGAGRATFDEDGQPRSMVGVNYDITVRKQAEAVLARDKEELERLVTERTARLQELVTELEHFSYSITHDMRAPLRSMTGFVEMAAELCGSPEVPEQKRLLQRISQSAARMDSLITDALSYSEAVRKHLPLTPIDPNLLLRGMLDSYPEFQVSRANIHLAGDIPPVFANEAGLTQCFSNLLNNAIKFAQPGQKPEIRVWAERTESPARPRPNPRAGPEPFQPGGFTPVPSVSPPLQDEGRPNHWVRIWVEDQGIGISETMLPRIFNMFSRGSTGQVGTGIGLALVRKVVDRMGGRVGVESQEGKGSRFWIELAPAERI